MMRMITTTIVLESIQIMFKRSKLYILNQLNILPNSAVKQKSFMQLKQRSSESRTCKIFWFSFLSKKSWSFNVFEHENV